MTPQFFIDLADAYRDLLAHYAEKREGCVILVHQNTPESAALMKYIGPKFNGPARWVALNKNGWDDVDIKHVIDAAYFLYRDPRLRIGEPHKYDGDGSGYGQLDAWVAGADFDELLDALR